MSDREPYFDSNASEQAFDDALCDPTRNRPAAGAAYAQSPQEVNLDWKGTSAATDFLGIESDSRVGEVPAAIGSGLDTSGGAALPSDSWLHGIQEGDVVTPPPPTPPSNVEAVRKGQRQEQENRLESIREKAGDSDRSLRLVKLGSIALVLVACAAAGYWYWKKSHQPAATIPPITEVAQKPGPKKAGPKKTPEPGPKLAPIVANEPGDTQPPAEQPIEAVQPPTPTPLSGPDEPDLPIDTTPGDPVAVAPTIQFPPKKPLEVTPTIDPNATAAAEPVAPPTTFRVPARSNEPLPGAVRRATEEDYANLWLESSVPMDKIGGERRIRTVSVGSVRVMLDNGEFFEGVLYAVGQNRVWLDMDLGRISFEGATVREITPMPKEAAAGSKQKGPDLSGLPHVEVRLPGGWITGRLVGREGPMVTLVTDTGIRMVVETDEVRPITAKKTRILGSVEKLGGPVPAAGPPARKP